MNLKEVEKLSKICRKYGIKSIALDGVKVNIEFDGTIQPLPSRAKTAQTTENIEQTELSDEDLLLWSSGDRV